MIEFPKESADGWPDDAPDGVWREVRGGPAASTNPPHVVRAEGQQPPAFADDEVDHWLGRISLVYVAHPSIPNLYQCCFDYMEPWDWSRQTEHVPTGRWVHGNYSGI